MPYCIFCSACTARRGYLYRATFTRLAHFTCTLYIFFYGSHVSLHRFPVTVPCHFTHRARLPSSHLAGHRAHTSTHTTLVLLRTRTRSHAATTHSPRTPRLYLAVLRLFLDHISYTPTCYTRYRFSACGYRGFCLPLSHHLLLVYTRTPAYARHYAHTCVTPHGCYATCVAPYYPPLPLTPVYCTFTLRLHTRRGLPHGLPLPAARAFRLHYVCRFTPVRLHTRFATLHTFSLRCRGYTGSATFTTVTAHHVTFTHTAVYCRYARCPLPHTHRACLPMHLPRAVATRAPFTRYLTAGSRCTRRIHTGAHTLHTRSRTLRIAAYTFSARTSSRLCALVPLPRFSYTSHARVRTRARILRVRCLFALLVSPAWLFLRCLAACVCACGSAGSRCVWFTLLPLHRTFTHTRTARAFTATFTPTPLLPVAFRVTGCCPTQLPTGLLLCLLRTPSLLGSHAVGFAATHIALRARHRTTAAVTYVHARPRAVTSPHTSHIYSSTPRTLRWFAPHTTRTLFVPHLPLRLPALRFSRAWLGYLPALHYSPSVPTHAFTFADYTTHRCYHHILHSRYCCRHTGRFLPATHLLGYVHTVYLPRLFYFTPAPHFTLDTTVTAIYWLRIHAGCLRGCPPHTLRLRCRFGCHTHRAPLGYAHTAHHPTGFYLLALICTHTHACLPLPLLPTLLHTYLAHTFVAGYLCTRCLRHWVACTFTTCGLDYTHAGSVTLHAPHTTPRLPVTFCAHCLPLYVLPPLPATFAHTFTGYAPAPLPTFTHTVAATHTWIRLGRLLTRTLHTHHCYTQASFPTVTGYTRSRTRLHIHLPTISPHTVDWRFLYFTVAGLISTVNSAAPALATPRIHTVYLRRAPFPASARYLLAGCYRGFVIYSSTAPAWVYYACALLRFTFGFHGCLDTFAHVFFAFACTRRTAVRAAFARIHHAHGSHMPARHTRTLVVTHVLHIHTHTRYYTHIHYLWDTLPFFVTHICTHTHTTHTHYFARIAGMGGFALDSAGSATALLPCRFTCVYKRARLHYSYAMPHINTTHGSGSGPSLRTSALFARAHTSCAYL